MDPETVARIELRKTAARKSKDGPAGQLVIDNSGEVVKRFASLADAQDFVNSQPDPDRFAIQCGESTAFDIRETAIELAESGESDEEFAAEQQFEQERRLPG